MTATRLTTKRVEKPWGRISLWPGFDSVVPGGAPVGEIWFEAPGDPQLLIKYLFTSEKLSIQVHPDDMAARARGYPRGKDEAWVVLAADPHATIAIGTVTPMTLDELRRAALDAQSRIWSTGKRSRRATSIIRPQAPCTRSARG